MSMISNLTHLLELIAGQGISIANPLADGYSCSVFMNRMCFICSNKLMSTFKVVNLRYIIKLGVGGISHRGKCCV